MIVSQARQDHLFGYRAKPIERANCVQASQRQRRIAGELFEEGHGPFVMSFIQQARSRVALPTAWMLKMCDEGLGARARQFRQLRLFESFRDDTINPPTVAAAGQIEMLLNDRRQARWVLDHLAIHVEDIER